MFYKELPLDEDNIFLANVAEHKEIEQIRFKKSEKKYANHRVVNQPRHYLTCSPLKY